MTALAQVAVVIPAHNESALLPGCLRSVTAAAACLPVPALTVVVLDACDDDSARLARHFGRDVHFMSIAARNVGAARAAGFAYARLLGRGQAAHTWYATTDADTVVDPDWLVRQIAVHADMVLGVVRVPRWRHYPRAVADRYQRDYVFGGPVHGHVHGANLGCRADTYWRLGGFAALDSGEDVDLVERFAAAGCRLHWDAQLSVATSDRRVGRAPRGFADHLAGVARAVAAS
jgi:glycosyltransferase involved in cell wall biosynthesis